MEKKVLEKLLERRDYKKLLEIQVQEYEDDRRKFNEFVQREKEFDERIKRIYEGINISKFFPLGKA